MSVSKAVLADKVLCQKITQCYLSEKKPTMAEVAKEYSTTPHTVQAIIQQTLTEEQRTAERVLRLSRSKMQSRNPMYGKTLEKHPNWKGACSDDKEHFTIKTSEGRVFLHRKVMADALGIPVKDLPRIFQVHHIDGNPANNSLDNLALVTSAGHRSLHRKYQELPRSPLWEKYEHLISKSEAATTLSSPEDL